MTLLGLMFSLPSMASQHQGFVGIGGVNNDPFLKRHMAAAGYEFRPQSNLSLNVDVHYSPDRGEADWKPLVEGTHHRSACQSGYFTDQLRRSFWLDGVSCEFCCI
ncbi:MAG: hypothetical protein CL930_03860 [Deltaproteobacteria bacterium]|nr:hypothetical protein [Deltaproteobacteria bacterium]